MLLNACLHSSTRRKHLIVYKANGRAQVARTTSTQVIDMQSLSILFPMLPKNFPSYICLMYLCMMLTMRKVKNQRYVKCRTAPNERYARCIHWKLDL